MIIIKTINSFSTVSLLIFLFTFLPITPPKIPPSTISTKVIGVNDGTLWEIRVEANDVNCENKIIYKELAAAVLVSIEKKKYKTTRLIGPPPIPKNDDITPRTQPITAHTKVLFTTRVLIFDFLIV